VQKGAETGQEGWSRPGRLRQGRMAETGQEDWNRQKDAEMWAGGQEQGRKTGTGQKI
jgi:hypothetical protein